MVLAANAMHFDVAGQQKLSGSCVLAHCVYAGSGHVEARSKRFRDRASVGIDSHKAVSISCSEI